MKESQWTDDLCPLFRTVVVGVGTKNGAKEGRGDAILYFVGPTSVLGNARSSPAWVSRVGQNWGKQYAISRQSMPMHTLMLKTKKALMSQYPGA